MSDLPFGGITLAAVNYRGEGMGAGEGSWSSYCGR